VVIVGGGYAGAALAKQYDAAMRKNKNLNLEVTLVDEKKYFQSFINVPFFWQQPDKANLGMKDHTSYLNASGKIQVVASKAKSITAVEVECEDGTIIKDFDALVIATGSRYNQQLIQQTINPSTTEKASIIVHGNQIPHVIQYKDAVASAERITFLGGGVTTIEILNALLSKYPKKHYTVVTSSDRLIPNRDVKVHVHQLARFTKLYKNNVEILFNERVTSIDHNELTLATSGKKIKSDVVFLCFGFTPNTEPIAAGAQKDAQNEIPLNSNNKFITVNKNLQTVKYPHVFAIGDVADTGVERRMMVIYDQLPVLTANLAAVLQNNAAKLQVYKAFGDKAQAKPALIIGNGPSFSTLASPNDGFVYGSFIFGIMKGLVEKFVVMNYV